MEEEQVLIKVRNYHLFSVRKVMLFLQSLSPEEVEIMELRYWYGYSIRQCLEMLYTSKSKIFRQIQNIFNKEYKNKPI